jgi:hypothetical protein
LWFSKDRFMPFDKKDSRWLLLGGLILWSVANPLTDAKADEPVPAPAQTPVEVVVSGRTSTLKSITIRKGVCSWTEWVRSFAAIHEFSTAPTSREMSGLPAFPYSGQKRLQ